MRAAECSYDMLGSLTPWCAGEIKSTKNRLHGTEAVDLIDENINGIELPPHILLELRMIGYPLTAYNRGELEDAINACSVDKIMLENPDAHSFRDKLKPKVPKKNEEKQSHHSHDGNDLYHMSKKIDDNEMFFSVN